MINIYKKINGALETVEQPEKGTWINIYPPFNPENLKKLSEKLNVPLDFFMDSIDIDERSRFEAEEGIELIVVKTPIVNEGSDDDMEAGSITIPIGIILTSEVVVTISPKENPVIDAFLNNRVRNFDPSNRARFVLQLFDKNVYYFLHYLKESNIRRNEFESELYNSMRNEELTKLLSLEKSLVYFVTALRSNEIMMMKLQRLDILKVQHKEHESDILEDVIVDNSQALEMANIYANILSGTMDAFASIISNNLNFVMKRLTSVTIVLMLPTLVASLYGMNVDLPFQNSPYAFILTILISVLLSIILIWFFLKKKWF